jgi:DNA-binding MarR family transcriptional regulator
MPTPPHRPIGYWLRRVDQLLERHIAEAQQASGLTRSGWQILNVLTEGGGAATATIANSLAAFMDIPEAQRHLSGLAERQWVAVDGTALVPVWQLTATGREAHAAALERQTVVRRRALAGVSEAEYETVMRLLERIAANLEPDEPLQSGT